MHAQYVQRGKATYYSKRATGARTSSGERVHHDSLTCAHRTYPFGTKLKVTDRGPFARGRIIDLSWKAAKELGMLAQGVAMVEVVRADKIVVPFKPSEEKHVIEFDFESSNVAEMLRPTWQEMKEVNRRTSAGQQNRHQAKRNDSREKHRPTSKVTKQQASGKQK